MARKNADIYSGGDDMSRVGYWTPETPEFLEKRDARRSAQRSSAVTYTQAKANIRRISIQNQEASAARQPRSGAAPIIDFSQLGATNAGHDFRARAEFSWERHEGDARRSRGGYRVSAEVSASSAPRSRRASGNRLAPSRFADGTRARSGFRFDEDRDERKSRHNDWREEFAEYDSAEEDMPRKSGLRERLRKARHEQRHRKADRAFSREYDDAAPAMEDGAPRAAVYEGRMGRTHHRAARMQTPGSQFGSRIAGFFSGILSALSLDRIVMRPWFAWTAVTVMCVVLAANAIYPAAQDYYLQTRANDQLAAEYAALVDRNEELEQHVQALQTDEGIAELAHESLGWVTEGEHSVSVLTDGSSNPGSASLSSTEAVAEGSVPAPETWYSPVLDAVFGYEG